jgi:hypothetical protein
MPREILHWQLVDEVILPWLRNWCTLNGYSAKTGLVAENVALIGSMIHDVPYFSPTKPPNFEIVAERLHGTNGEDTATPLRLAGKDANQSADRTVRLILTALVLGMTSHLVLDSSVHPLVFGITGNYYDQNLAARGKARHDHYVFEGYIDQWSKDSYWVTRTPPKLKDLLVSLRDSELQTIGLFLARSVPRMSIDGPALTMKDWTHGLTQMAVWQSRFKSPAWGAIAKGLSFILPQNHKKRPLEGLFYLGRSSLPKGFTDERTFIHPGTGEKVSTSIARLYADARDELRGILTSFSNQPGVINVRNLSASLGVPYMPITAMKL